MLRRSLILFTCVILLIGLGEATFLPDYKYVQDIGLLRLHIVPATWPDARLRCHLEGGILASPTTDAISTVMKTTMLAHRLARSSVFTDIHASNPKGEFKSTDGNALSNVTLQWADGEPNNLNNDEECLAMTGAGELADVSCSSVHPYFCLKTNVTSSRKCAATGKGEATFLPDYEYVQDIGWLRLHIVPATWPDARLRCHLEGGILASPTTDAISTVMKTTMLAHRLARSSVFTDIHASNPKGEFKSTDGNALSNVTLQWADGEPNNLNNDEECLAMTGAGELADVSCSSVHPYFCLKTNVTSSRKCAATGKGYKLEPRTGNCYKFHTEPLKWPQAAMACAKERAYLVVINSDLESQVIKDLFAENPPETLIGARYNDKAQIGIVDVERNGSWLTLYGDTLTEAGFEKWAANEPNNPGEERCGTVTRDGLLNDGNCKYDALTFICETTFI